MSVLSVQFIMSYHSTGGHKSPIRNLH